MDTILKETELDLMGRTKTIANDIRKRAKETEEIRRIPDTTINQLKENDIFKMLRPVRYGGLEVSIQTYSQVIVEISKACASTGWVASLCAIREMMVAESFKEKAHLDAIPNYEERLKFLESL